MNSCAWLCSNGDKASKAIIVLQLFMVLLGRTRREGKSGEKDSAFHQR